MYEKTLQRKKDERKQKAIQDGRIYAKGRPKYIKTSTIGCSAITDLENNLQNINLSLVLV